jgi:hypothetical protein
MRRPIEAEPTIRVARQFEARATRCEALSRHLWSRKPPCHIEWIEALQYKAVLFRQIAESLRLEHASVTPYPFIHAPTGDAEW